MPEPAKDARRLKELLKEAKSDTSKGPPWAEIKPVSQLANEPPPVIIEGLWRRQEVLLIGGHSKSWKSWGQMDLMFCVANGFAWLAWPNADPGKVLHIDLELFDFEIRKRFELIQDSYGCGSLENIDVFSLRGYNFNLNDFSLLVNHIEPGKYVGISFDPTYRMLAGSRLSESDSGVIIDLMNRALQLGKRLKSGMSLLQHFSKGSQSDKRAIDAFSGSGVWGRAPDACVTFREHEDEKCYTVETDLRHWPHRESFVAEYVEPRFQVAQDKDPERLKVRKTGRPKAFSICELCKLIEDDEYIPYSNLQRRAEAASVKKPTFDRRLKEAKVAGYLALNPVDATYFLTSVYLGKFRNGQH